MGEQTVRDLMMMNEETGEVTKFEGVANVSLSTEQNDKVWALTGKEFILSLAERLGATITFNWDGCPSISINGKPVNFREFMVLPTNPIKRREHISQKRFKKILMANRLQRNAVDWFGKTSGAYYGCNSYKEIIEKYAEWVYR